MEDRYKFSVIVLSYHPRWEKMRLTLDSILQQTFQDYELIVADDGSEDPLTAELKAYFESKGFDRYKLVHNEENRGTLKNLISGIECARGRYIRAFGAGDLFYSAESLKTMYEFMEKNSSRVAFGMMRGYAFKEGGVEYSTVKFPFDIKAYKIKNKKRIARNLVLFCDTVPGASICYEKDYILKIFGKMESKVRYLEDIFPIMVALDGVYMDFLEEYYVWYEDNTGLSTSGNKEWRNLLLKDRDAFFSILFEEYAADGLVRKRKKLEKAYKIKNPYLRVLRMAFVTPSVLLWAIDHYLQVFRGEYTAKENDGFLLHEKFWKD